MSSPVARVPELPVLVGRAAELDAVLAAVLQPPSVVLIEGEAGIGKTRLIHEAVGSTVLSGRRVLPGRCHPLREPFPYGPIVDLLRQLRGDLDHPAIRLDPVCGALRPDLPELSDLLPPTPELLHDPRAARHRLFRAVRALLEALGPTVVVVEDLHWADDGTRDLVGFLVDDPPPQLSVLLSYRREELPAPGLPLGHAYRGRPGVATASMALGPLQVPDVGRLCAGIRGADAVSEDFAAEVHRRTAGIPFVVEEFVRALPAELPAVGRGVELPALSAMEVPALLREAGAEKVSRLSAAAAEAVDVASVLRTASAEEVIAAVLGVDPDGPAAADPVAAIAEALAAGVLYEVDDRLGFRHALAQQAVYQGLSGPRRRRLHRQVVAVLEHRTPSRSGSWPTTRGGPDCRHGGGSMPRPRRRPPARWATSRWRWRCWRSCCPTGG